MQYCSQALGSSNISCNTIIYLEHTRPSAPLDASARPLCCLQVHLKNPEIMAKINKLVAAGIIQVG